MIRQVARSLLIWATALTVCQGCRRDAIPVSAADSAMTARYEALLKEQLTSPDPHAAQVAINCEVVRLISTYGPDRTIKPIEAAAARALGPETRTRVQEIDRQLANHVFTIGKGCDSLP